MKDQKRQLHVHFLNQHLSFRSAVTITLAPFIKNRTIQQKLLPQLLWKNSHVDSYYEKTLVLIIDNPRIKTIFYAVMVNQKAIKYHHLRFQVLFILGTNQTKMMSEIIIKIANMIQNKKLINEIITKKSHTAIQRIIENYLPLSLKSDE